MDSLDSVNQALMRATRGEMVVVFDGTTGVLAIPAVAADAAVVNFMATHARGLVCLALTQARATALGLVAQPRRNERATMNFALSIEARDGVSTGISAADRARTIAAAIDPTLGPDAVRSPGHVFPVIVEEHGVLASPGVAEAAIDLARLSGFAPAGVFCAIMDEGGALADEATLVAMARRHQLAMIAPAELAVWRRRTERLVEATWRGRMETAHGGFDATVFRNRMTGAEHIALVNGRSPCPLVCIHTLSLIEDVIGCTNFDRRPSLRDAMARIGAEGGAIILIREVFKTDLGARLSRRSEGALDGYGETELTEQAIAAQILTSLGIADLRLIQADPSQATELRSRGLRLEAEPATASVAAG